MEKGAEKIICGSRTSVKTFIPASSRVLPTEDMTPDS
jgi:hypothetical protein